MSTTQKDVLNSTLHACFDIYYYYTNSALTVSSQELSELHIGMLLEVRSGMTHITRANCAPKIKIQSRINEAKSAQGHFIRAALDGYKIAYIARMKKIDDLMAHLKKYTLIPSEFQIQHNTLKSRRTDLTLQEDSQPTSLETLDDYKALYLDAIKYHEKLSKEYDAATLNKFKFKNIFMSPHWWFYTLLGAFITWVLGMLL